MHRLRLVPLLLLALALGGCPRTPTPGPSTPIPEPTPAPPPTPPPAPYVPNKRLEVGKLFNGIPYHTQVETEFGTDATTDRENKQSYVVELKVHVDIPKPHQDVVKLSLLNPQLPAVLPTLSTLLKTAKISPVFDDLYRLKVDAIQSSVRRLDNLPSKHNFYDCETILQLQNAETKRRAVLMQADMDTDTDGSDADRVPEIDGSSVTFQPFTSYRWAKKSKQPNSFVPGRQALLKKAQQDAAAPGLSAAKQQELKNTIARLKEEVSDLGKYSFLVGSTDPYVVLPGVMFTTRNRGPFSPGVGDYCVVIHGNTLFPAVVGDVGPMSVVGEASLRICKEIDARSDANNRAVNDLKVTYLLFPGTADKPFDVPDLEKWRTRCETLLKEIGGVKGELFTWVDLTKPKATPAPVTPVPATPAPATPAPATPTTATPGPSTPAPASPPPATPAPGTPPPATPPPATPPAATPPAATPSATPNASPPPAATRAPARKATPKRTA